MSLHDIANTMRRGGDIIYHIIIMMDTIENITVNAMTGSPRQWKNHDNYENVPFATTLRSRIKIEQ